MIQSRVAVLNKTRAKGSRLQQTIFVFLTFSIVLSPNFTVRTGFYKPSAVDFVLLGVLAFWFLALPVRRTNLEGLVVTPGAATLIKILLGMLYVAIISIGVGTIAFGQRLIFRDMMILPMIVRYGLILLIASLWTHEARGRRIFLWALLGSLGLSALVGVLQHFNLLGINDWLTPLYVSEYTQVVGLYLVKLGLPGARVLGTNGDPRHYAYILVVGLGLSLAIFVNLRRRILRRVAVIVFGLSLMSLGFTASRTAVLAGTIVLLVAIMMHWRGSRSVSRVIGLLIVLLTVLVLTFPAFESQTFEERVLTLGTASYDSSINARIRDLTTPFRLALEHPLIWVTGRGPSKAAVRTDSHNDFGWYFYRFGLPGLMLYLSLIVYSLRRSWRVWRDTSDPWQKTISMAALLLVINWFVFAMAENIFKDPQLMALNMLLVGAAVGTIRAKHQ